MRFMLFHELLDRNGDEMYEINTLLMMSLDFAMMMIIKDAY